MTKTCIIDYGIGNLASIYNGIHSAGNDVIVSSDSEKISKSTHLILPGVGSFQKGMEGIESKGLIKILNDQVLLEKKPILGICLGMQLFASYGLEDGYCKGLDWIKGKVEKINVDLDNIKVPHMGWNEVKIKNNNNNNLIEQKEINNFYFVHSYYFDCDHKENVVGKTDYGINFTSFISKENIYGVQFHPEKSSKQGLNLIKKFLKL